MEAENRSAHSGGQGFCLVPPGPVTDRIEVELRAAVINPGTSPRRYRVSFHREHQDRKGKSARIGEVREVTLVPGEKRLVSVWWRTADNVGKHRLLCRVEEVGGSRWEERLWPFEVISSATPALPLLQAVWMDGFGLRPETYARKDNAPPDAEDLRFLLRALAEIQVRAVIFTYVEYHGTFFYPSRLSFYDRDVKKDASGMAFPFDVVGTLLDEADRLGLHVFLGLGRSGDTMLLWEFDKPDWKDRCDTAIGIAKRVAGELWERYGKHPSLYGWYLTHEMVDLARSSAYYDPIADYCHTLAPEKPLIAAPAGKPIYDTATLKKSHVDIFAYQDAVGAGYVPYKYTYKPEKRIKTLDSLYKQYKELHKGARKHFWSDLEIWEMDGTKGYGGAYPPPFSRVRRQIEIEARYVEWITGYECTGFLDPPGRKKPLQDERAARLYRDYAAYVRATIQRLRSE
jgi:hypothetical protein